MSSEEAKDYGLIDEIIQGRPKSTGDGAPPRVGGSISGRPRSDSDGGPEAGGGAATR
jgi:hypothetical protein